MNKKALDRIHELMNKKNLSFYQLAINADLERSTIKNWFSGSEPSVKALEKVVDALGVTMAQIYAEADSVAVSQATLDHILRYEMLSPEDKQAVDKYIDALNVYSTKDC